MRLPSTSSRAPNSTAPSPAIRCIISAASSRAPRPFLAADHVTTDAGTGLVHMAPDHGEEDFIACKKLGIDPVFAVDDGGFYRPDWLWLGGQGSVINTKFNGPDGPILTDLREAGALLSAGDFKHSYPHSWRSKARIIYRCTPLMVHPDGPSQHSPRSAPRRRSRRRGRHARPRRRQRPHPPPDRARRDRAHTLGAGARAQPASMPWSATAPTG